MTFTAPLENEVTRVAAATSLVAAGAGVTS